MPISQPVSHAAVLFDLDGTLLDTLPSLVAACNATMEELGLPPFSPQEVETFLGMGQRIFVQRMMAAAEVDDPSIIDRAQEIYNVNFLRYSVHGVQVYQGIPQVLERLKRGGFKLAVMTNKRQDLSPAVLASVFPEGTFEIIRGSRPGYPLKPDPTTTLQLLADLEADPARSYFVGDSDIDIKTGRAAGMRTLAVAWGFQPVERLEALSPDLLAREPSDLLAFIEEDLGRTL